MSTPDDADPPIDPDVIDERRGVRPSHLKGVNVAAVATGGMLGTLCRYVVAEWVPTEPSAWPTATFVVNTAGALILGVLLEAVARHGPETSWLQRLRLFGGTGFCGGMTTYSALAIESDLLLRSGDIAMGVSYLAASVFTGLVATVAGIALAARLPRRGGTR